MKSMLSGRCDRNRILSYVEVSCQSDIVPWWTTQAGCIGWDNGIEMVDMTDTYT